MNQPLVFSILGTAHALEARLEAALDAVGLSLAKVGLLSDLAASQEPISLSALAEKRACVRSNITQLIDRLEKDGLVRRRPDPADRRGVLAALTAAGKRAHTKGIEVLEREQAAIARALNAGETASLTAALEVLAK